MLSVLETQERSTRERRGPARSGGGRRRVVNLIVAIIALAAIFLLGYRFLQESENAIRATAYRMTLRLDENRAVTVDLRNERLRVLMDGISQADRPQEGEERFEVQVSLDGLKRIVDGLGGVVVHIPETIEYRGGDGLPVRIDAGLRRLDADRVEAYFLRPGASHAASLRVIALGLASRAAELDAAGVSLDAILYAAMDGAAKGEDGKNPYRLASLFRATKPLGPADVSIEWSAAVTAPVVASPPPTAAASMIEEVNLPIKVRILNGTGRPGLAARAAARLPIDAFRVIETANADRFGYAQTVVRSATPAVARHVVDKLGLGTHEERGADHLAGADVEVVLGADARNRW